LDAALSYWAALSGTLIIFQKVQKMDSWNRLWETVTGRLQKNKFSSYLFMGTNFAPPDELPLGITIHGLAKEVEDRQATFGFIINSGITALQLLPGDAKKKCANWKS
jgi:hypothetical protein